VAGDLVELELADVGREDLRIALLAQLLADEGLQLLADDGPVRGPEDQALAHVLVDDEELQVLPELAVVAELGLLGLLEVLGELLLRRERGPVDALELLVLLAAAVVGAGDREQLEGLDLGGVAHVRAGAQVHELAVLVERDLLALGDVRQAAELVALLAAGPDDLGGLLAGDLPPQERLVLVGDLLHLGLDLHQVLGRQLVVEVDVVVEARVRGRADVELGLGENPQEGRRKDVRGRVAEFFEGSHGHGGRGEERRLFPEAAQACSRPCRPAWTSRRRPVRRAGGRPP
jgi:hypothetical protein